MRLQKVIITISVMAILIACTNATESNSSASGLSGTGAADTLVYSAPQNYFTVLGMVKKSSKVEIRSYKDMLELFEKLNYTPEAWQAGIREVPRVYLPLIGERWGAETSKEVSVENKKRLFFRGLAPLILRANELILMDRELLGKLRSSFSQNKPIAEKDQVWIKKLAQVYRINLDGDQVTGALIEDLWKKVDIVPVSLALAQAAEESGWGTSRFAAEGNAVYGQWTWGDNAIKPEQQRKELGNYGIAAFESLQQSVCAYMLNLNTHNAYERLRNKRAELRNKNQKITGLQLAETLTKYSERGEEYVQGLKSMINSNKLAPADDAYLSNDPPIYLVPVAD
jgi:uncharacterized FlgJ-related protein